jgi:uridine monophosphate synthetase
MIDAAVAKALITAGALRFDSEKPFVLASRKIAPVYVDVRQLTGAPAGWSATVEALAAVVKGISPTASVSGGELADLFFSVPVALRLGRRHLAIRKAPRGYGAGGRLVGSVAKGEEFVHVSDLVTAGTSAMQWVAVIREAGGELAHYVTVFDRVQGGREGLAKEGVQLHALVSLDGEFLRSAVEAGALDPARLGAVNRYLADPDGWAREFLLANPAFLTERIMGVGGKLTRSEGFEVLAEGYPELRPQLGGQVAKKLREIGAEKEASQLS